MARTRRPAYHHGDLRRALLDATLRLAAERSPAGVSLREAAREAGVSQAAPYRHFRDKQAMLAAAAEEGFSLLLKLIGERPRAQLTAGEQLLEWVDVYVRFAVGHPAHFRLMWGQGSPPKATTATLQALARETFQSFYRTVAAAAAPWRLRVARLREMALELWSIAHGAAMLALDGQTLFLAVPPSRVHELARRAAAGYLEGLSLRPQRDHRVEPRGPPRR